MPMLQEKKVLVVGATGFLGRALMRRLVEHKASVAAVSRSGDAGVVLSGQVSGWPCDASDPDAIGQVVRAVGPDVVFHLASDSRGGRELELVPSSVRNDVLTTVNLLYHTASSAPKARFVMAASLEEPQPTDASAAEPTPHSPYAAAKWASSGYGRMFRQLYGLDVRIVRPMMTYGPGQKPFKFVPATILSLLRGEPARLGSASRRVDWVFLDDVIDGMLAAALAPALGQTVDLGSGQLVCVADCAHEIARQLGRTDLLEFGERDGDGDGDGDGTRGREIERAADTASALQLIGFSASTGLQEGLARTIAWYRERILTGAEG